MIHHVRLCSGLCRGPEVEFPQIYIDLYLIDTPEEFTREKLKAYKSLEAYNYCTKRNGFTIQCVGLDTDSEPAEDWFCSECRSVS